MNKQQRKMYQIATALAAAGVVMAVVMGIGGVLVALPGSVITPLPAGVGLGLILVILLLGVTSLAILEVWDIKEVK